MNLEEFEKSIRHIENNYELKFDGLGMDKYHWDECVVFFISALTKEKVSYKIRKILFDDLDFIDCSLNIEEMNIIENNPMNRHLEALRIKKQRENLQLEIEKKEGKKSKGFKI